MPVIRSPRSVAFKVTLTPELHERLRDVAAQLGLAPATIGSMAIGQYVAQMSNTLGAANRAVDAMTAHAGPELARQMKLIEAMPSSPSKKFPAVKKSAPGKKR